MWYTFATFHFFVLWHLQCLWISIGCQELSETFEENWSLSHFSKAYITWLRNLRNWLDHLFDQFIWKTATKNKVAHEVRKDSWAISDTRCERFSKVSCENGYSFNNNMIWFCSGWKSEELTQEIVNIMGISWDITWLVVSNMAFIFHFIYGMSSFPLTFIFFRGVGIPPTRYSINNNNNNTRMFHNMIFD